MEQENNGSQLMRVESVEIMPVVSLQQMTARYKAIEECMLEIMKPDIDYGVIPGTGSKPTLLKQGAENLAKFFGLRNEFETDKIEDWTGTEHNGEPLFAYRVKCRVYRGDMPVAEYCGSCNSWEAKYRYRKAERTCPSCGAATIIKGKKEYGGGWLCFAKKGGCGAKYADGNEKIEGQQVGRILNHDVFDQINTIEKMAEKRAYVGAMIAATGVSGLFSQDLEDMNGNGHGEPLDVEAERTAPKANGGAEPQREPQTEQAAPQNQGSTDEIVLKFKARPATKIIDNVKGAGFRWDPARACWHGATTMERIDMAEFLKEEGLLQ